MNRTAKLKVNNHMGDSTLNQKIIALLNQLEGLGRREDHELMSYK